MVFIIRRRRSLMQNQGFLVQKGAVQDLLLYQMAAAEVLISMERNVLLVRTRLSKVTGSHCLKIF
jgi:hypothetical protein